MARRRAVPRVVVVGAGRAARSLAASLRRARVPVTSVSSRGRVHVVAADVVVVAVTDAAIPAVAAALECEGAPLVVHMAGSLPLAVTAPHARRGAFHPLASLDGTTPVPRGTLCACDADSDDDLALLMGLARRLGLEPARVHDDARARYHAGAVIAGNLATALLQLGVDELVRVGIDADVARHSLARLLSSTAARCEVQPLALALTGPVARGDVETVARHLAVLDDPATRAVYRQLTRVLVGRVAPAKARGLDWHLLDDTADDTADDSQPGS